MLKRTFSIFMVILIILISCIFTSAADEYNNYAKKENCFLCSGNTVILDTDSPITFLNLQDFSFFHIGSSSDSTSGLYTQLSFGMHMTSYYSDQTNSTHTTITFSDTDPQNLNSVKDRFCEDCFLQVDTHRQNNIVMIHNESKTVLPIVDSEIIAEYKVYITKRSVNTVEIESQIME